MHKLLIIAPSWVGDTVMMHSLVKSLKATYPHLFIAVAARTFLCDLLQKMPDIDAIIPFNHPRNICVTYRYGKTLQAQYNFSHAILLPNSFKSALLPFFAKIPVRIGFNRALRWLIVNHCHPWPGKQQAFVSKILSLANLTINHQHKALYYPQLISTLAAQRAVATKFKLATQHPILALCPGAEFGISKRWPPEYYATVAKHYLQAGWDIWLLGSHNDSHSASIIMDLTQQRCVNLVGSTTLAEAVDILAQTTIVLSNDSGLMHIAAALAKPLVAVYGATNPELTPPLSNSAIIHYLNLPCQPCGQRTCPLGNQDCLKKLSPAIIITAIAQHYENINH